jgi:hypothetical protein
VSWQVHKFVPICNFSPYSPHFLPQQCKSCNLVVGPSDTQHQFTVFRLNVTISGGGSCLLSCETLRVESSVILIVMQSLVHVKKWVCNLLEIVAAFYHCDLF